MGLLDRLRVEPRVLQLTRPRTWSSPTNARSAEHDVHPVRGAVVGERDRRTGRERRTVELDARYSARHAAGVLGTRRLRDRRKRGSLRVRLRGRRVRSAGATAAPRHAGQELRARNDDPRTIREARGPGGRNPPAGSRGRRSASRRPRRRSDGVVGRARGPRWRRCAIRQLALRIPQLQRARHAGTSRPATGALPPGRSPQATGRRTHGVADQLPQRPGRAAPPPRGARGRACRAPTRAGRARGAGGPARTTASPRCQPPPPAAAP